MVFLLTEITASDAGSSSMQVNMPTKSMGVGKHQLLDSTQPVLSTHGGSSVIRSSSSHNSHSQQTIGSQKGTCLILLFL